VRQQEAAGSGGAALKGIFFGPSEGAPGCIRKVMRNFFFYIFYKKLFFSLE
jgi:hypothetical protein